MKIRFLPLAATILTALIYAVPSPAQTPPQGTVPVAKDLTAVIALQGLPCGQVTSVSQKGENDYLARCKDGNEYRVFVNPDGRVVVDKK